MSTTRHRHDANRAIERLGIESGQTILDLGCGDGYHSRLITLKSPRLLVDLDISLGDLQAISSSGWPGCSWLCADGLRLPFANDVFDRVVCSLVFYLLPLQPALDELYRVIKPAGKAYLRLPMLAWGRAVEAVRLARNPRQGLYSACHVINGLYYSLSGTQLSNPFLRRDRWACYVPRRRFEAAVLRAGFLAESLEIDYPKPKTPSIEAWLRKP